MRLVEGNQKNMGAYFISRLMRLILPAMNPAEGAYTSLFAATSSTVRRNKEKYAGAYLVPYGQIQEPSKDAKDPVAARELWEASERIAKEMME